MGTAKKKVGKRSVDFKSLYEGMKSNILKFALIICKDVLKDTVPDFHKEIYTLLTTKDRIALAAPRGFAKSSLAKVYILWCVLFKIRLDICIISASETLAVEHLRYVKTKLESDQKILSWWGDLKSEKWTENHLIVQHPCGTRINVRAKGAGGQIRGFRPDCLVLDDIETDDSVESEEQRKKLKSWLFKACINTLLPGGQLVLIGTLIHPLSVLSDLLDTPNGWDKKKYKAYIEGIEKEGHELWPEARNHTWLQQRKSEIGSWAFAAEYMNDPKTDETAPIKDDQIRYWEELPKQMGLVIAVDPAYSEDAKADWKVACLVGMDQNHNRYLVHYVRTHEPQGAFIDAILNLWLQHKNNITSIGIPNKGVEKSFFQSFLKRAEERHLFPPTAELGNVFTSQTGGKTRDKKSRVIAALQPLFEQGKYYIGANHIEARDELLTIGSSRWDDVVDAMAYAEQIITPRYYEQQEYKPVTAEVSPEGYGIEY